MQYDLMSRDRSRKMMDNLRLAISTATSLSVDTAQAFWDRFGVPLTQAFGVIEIGLPCINLHYAMEKMDSVGHVLPGFDIRLIEQDESIGQSSISFRGKGILDAYYDPWQDRSDILDDGWFCTGDLGELDEDDCLYIRGRATEMINVGGMKFFPHEVETVLASHPAIEEAVVYPSRQGNSREFTCAQVVSKSDITNLPTSAELRQYCAKRLAHFKVPQEVEYVSSLERTASGKILRRVVVRDY